MRIVIPTFHREDNQKCFNKMPLEIQGQVTLVTHSGRGELLRSSNPTARVEEINTPVDGIASVRAAIVDQFGGDGKLMIIDDSCTFKKRNAELKLVDMDASDYQAMFSRVSELLDTYPMVGISDQGGNNRVPEEYKEIGRSYSCYGVNVAELKKLGVNFDGMYQKNPEIKLYEDFYLILKLLTLGHKNAILYSYAFNHPHGKKGGNSTIRTNELQKKCLLALRDEFPGLVELVKKEDPSWKAGLEDTDDFRWEAKIAWQEAYKRGLSAGADLSDFF